MKFHELAGIDWQATRGTAEWAKLLNELLLLAQAEQDGERRDAIADALDAFADHSTSPELHAVTLLDASARKAARALRIASMQASVAALREANAEFQAAAKEIAATQHALRKEAAKLRMEAIAAAVGSLTDTISSLKHLSRTIDSGDQAEVAAAVASVVADAQQLRALLESRT